MKKNHPSPSSRLLRVLSSGALALGLTATAWAQGTTAFTYQGQLQDGATAVNGRYDFSFTVWNAVSGPTQVGPTVTPVAVPVSNGLFTVALDFGSSVFNGGTRWLQISVRTNGAGTFSTLSPRQPLLPTPYALFAPNAGSAASAVTAATATTAGTANIANSVANNAVTVSGIANGQVVKSLNGLTDQILLSAGTNVVLRTNGNTLSFSAGPWQQYQATNTWFAGGRVGIGKPPIFGALDVFDGTGTNQSGGSIHVGGIGANGDPKLIHFGDMQSSSLSYVYLGENGQDDTMELRAARFYFNSGNVGIFKTNPATALDVNGTVTANNFVGNGSGLTLTSLSPTNLNLQGDTRLNRHEIYFREGTDPFHGLGWYGAGKEFGGVNVDGPVLYGYDGGGLGTTGGGNTNLALRWRTGGKVIIDPHNANAGTLAPGLTFGDNSGEGIASRRTVGDNQNGLDFYTANQPRMTIANNGNVGIGTSTPTEKLEVNGKVKATTFQGDGSGLVNVPGTVVWQTRLGGSATATPNTGYIAQGPNLLTLLLPAAPLVGAVVEVLGVGTGGWRINANIGQYIQPLDGGSGGGGAGAWVPRASNRNWTAVASSSDGTKLTASATTGLYTSADSGVTWAAHETGRSWAAVAASSDGTKLVAGSLNEYGGYVDGYIYTSTSSGAAWTQRTRTGNWRQIASSADGTKLVAIDIKPDFSNQLFVSADSGVNWTVNVAWPNAPMFQSVASAADGITMMAAVYGGRIYFRTNTLNAWYARASVQNWWGVACSSDAAKVVAVVYGGQIYTSADYGSNWVSRDSSRNWSCVASSSDGTKLIAAVSAGQIYTSVDSGVSWTPAESNRNWVSVASSGDGNKLVAVVNGGQIYTYVVPTSGGGGMGGGMRLMYIGDGAWVPVSTQGTITWQ